MVTFLWFTVYNVRTCYAGRS